MKARLSILTLVLIMLLFVAVAAMADDECGAYEHCVIKTAPVALYAKAAPHAFIGLYSQEYLQEVTDTYYNPPADTLQKLNSGLRAGYWVKRADTDMWDWPPPPPPR